ncbi:hypothetical protein CGN00_16645 [Salmonella enterica]|nr:hypothetical protein [Salmonella enterica]ECH9069441.1 hypothetical protein [Salmonella enterica subsp. enterica]EAZ8978573.1 hypothetical protein [Salmonella enterica]EBA2181052.1 hypothetical protein [Salmonella enterica]EBP2593313.1 hypothetical protein [Salmonella enterica]
MKERGITDGLTMNQLAERNAEHVTTIAALEARCAALAAENARLSDIAKGGAFVMQEALMKYEFGVGMTMQAEDFIRDARSKTPATDAFLAEVRAQGVEMFADKYRAQLTALPTTPENIFDAAHVRLRYQIFDADEFAAQLRKGVQS